MRRAIVLAMATLLLLSLAAAPTLAAQKEPTGVLLRAPSLTEVQTFPADTPFHVRHGFANETIKWLGKYGFELDVDGVPQTTDFKEIAVDREAGATVLWYFNYPAGMTGTHVFTGRWYAPCNDVGVSCDGARVGTVVMTLEWSSTVSFQ